MSVFLLIVCLWALIAAAEAQDGGNVTFYIEHSLSAGSNAFTPRTKIQLVSRPDGKQGILYLDKNTISGDDVGQFRKLVDAKGFYTVRIRTERPDFTGAFVVTSLPVVRRSSAFVITLTCCNCLFIKMLLHSARCREQPLKRIFRCFWMAMAISSAYRTASHR